VNRRNDEQRGEGQQRDWVDGSGSRESGAHTLAVDTAGGVWAWGRDEGEGRLGVASAARTDGGSNVPLPVPLPAALAAPCTAAAGGGFHSLLLAGFQFSLFLSLANFCSAYAWQPLTNALTAFAHASPFPDDQNGAFFLVLFSLWVLDAAVYFCGAQLARLLLVSWPLRWSAIEPAGTVSSLLYDGTLAWSVGACAGSFYCVDAPNPLTRAFDVKRKTTILQGAVLGGLSNTMGFLFAQALQKCVCLACISHDALALTL
jgi:hypothetical protein